MVQRCVSTERNPGSGGTYEVICVSMKMRMKTKRAGTTDAPIIQVGNGCLSPKGLMNQPLLSGDVTEKPEGTLSFCKQTNKSLE